MAANGSFQDKNTSWLITKNFLLMILAILSVMLGGEKEVVVLLAMDLKLQKSVLNKIIKL